MATNVKSKSSKKNLQVRETTPLAYLAPPKSEVKTLKPLTKEYIEQIKLERNGIFARLLEDIKRDNKQMVFLLENLGRLPDHFDVDVFLPLLTSKNDNIRFWTVKNIGKMAQEKHIQILYEVARNDIDSMVKREAISSLGRMRNSKTIDILIKFLTDNDPKIISQAMRGLLVFKSNDKVKEKLRVLINHPNEMIQSVIKKEFFANEVKESKLKHTDTYSCLKNTVVNGDTIEIMKLITDEAVHLTFTSPPYYNARDYSVYPSYKAYLEFLVTVFKEVHRITKEGRFLIVNTSPIIIPRVSRQHSSIRYPIPFDLHHYLIEMGWEFIDDIVWLKPEACVKDRNGGFKQHRKPLAYKPNTITEYLMVYRKKTTRLIDWNIREYDWKIVQDSKILDGFETTNVWRIDPTFDKVHSAVFPVELCNRVIQFYSFKNDLVFDPFAGSGTLGKAAKKLNRYFFLTELNKTYFEAIKNNLCNQTLFSGVQPKALNFEEFKQLIQYDTH